MLANVNQVLDRADFVWVDGNVFRTSYLRFSDEDTKADDVLIEATNDEAELFFTKADLERCEDLGDGSLRLPNGSLVRFLTSATVH
jgi:hypothetical protein